MAGNSVEFRVVVNADGLVTGMKQVTNFGNETQKTGKKARAASDDMAHLNYTMNQGVVGASSAARSFSKLNQSIGSGNGGLVGAYATLAANAFAVSAAFNSLRTAVQTEQLLQGLEVQGAKTGRTLSTVAQNIRTITEGSISAADAMKAAAQGSAAGLSGKDLQDLTQVATNAAKVLGRNLPDAMERVIKGVTKLEPELLDELGLMTKLTQAYEAYARQQGKAVSSLTNFEKSRAFVEAIKKEGQVKFGGIEGQVDVNQLDKVAAKFDDLVNASLRFVTALAPVRIFFERLTESSTGLLSLLLLFAATIRRQLLGTFADIAARATKAAEIVRNKAKEMNAEARAAVAKSMIGVVTAQKDLATADALSKRAPAGFKQNIADMVAGKATADQYKTSIDSLTRSNKAFDTTITKGSAEKKAEAQQAQILNNMRIESIDALKKAQEKAADSQKKNDASLLNASVARRNALKQEFVANTLNAASNLSLGNSYSNIIKAMVMAYRESRTQTQATMASAAAAGKTEVPWRLLTKAFEALEPVTARLKASLTNLTAPLVGPLQTGFQSLMGTIDKLKTSMLNLAAPVLVPLQAGFQSLGLKVDALKARMLAMFSSLGTSAPLLASLQTRFQGLGIAMSGLSATMFGLKLAATAMAVTLVASLNIVATLLSVFSLGEMFYKKFIETESDRRKKKAMEELGQVLESTTAKNKEYNRVLSSNLDLSDKIITANIIKANSFIELATSLTKSSDEYQRNLDIQEKIAKRKEEMDKKADKRRLPQGAMLPKTAEEFTDSRLLDIAEKAGIDPDSKVFQKTAGRVKGAKVVGQSSILGIPVQDLMGTFGSFDQQMLDQQKSLEDLTRKYPELNAEILANIGSMRSNTQAYDTAIKILAKFIPKVQAQANGYENLKSQLQAVEQSSANFSRSLKVTTPYDDQIEKVTGLELAFRSLSFSAKRISGKELEEVNSALTKMPASFAASMSVSTQATLDSFNAISLKINELTAQREFMLTKDGKADVSKIDAELKSSQQDQLFLREQIIKTVPKEITAYKNLLTDNQEMVILQSAQVSLAQAKLGALQRQGIVTGEDVRRQITLQNKVIDQQIKQEQAQIKILEAEANRLEFKELQIAQEEKILNLMIDQGAQAEKDSFKALRNSLENERISAIAAKDEDRRLKAIEAINAFNKLMKGNTDAKLSPQELLVLKKQEEADTIRAKRIQEATVAARKIGVVALEFGKTTKVEENVQATKQDIGNARTLAGLANDTKQLTIDTTLAQDKLNDSRTGGLNTLGLELKAIKDSADLRIKISKAETAFKIRELDLDINKAKVLFGINSEQYKYFTELKKLTTEKGAAEVKSLEVQKEVNILEKLGISNMQDALQILQQSLELYQRRVDLAREVADQESQIARNAAEIRIMSVGGQVDEKTRLAFENEAAQIALESANEQYKLRIKAIDIEFKLLAAQKALTTANLIKAEAELRDKKLIPEADTISQAIKELKGIDLAPIKELQETQAKNTLILAKQTAEKAGLAFQNAFRPQNSMMAAFANLGERIASRRRAATPSTTGVPESTGKTPPAQTDTKKPFDNVKLSFMEVMDAINIAVGESMRQFEELSAAMSERLGQDFGPQGKILQALSSAMNVLPQNFKVVSDSINKITEVSKAKAEEAMTKMTESSTVAAEQVTTTSQTTEQAQQKSKEGFKTQMQAASAAFSAIASVTGAIASILKASSDAKIAGIDKEIAAEQKRDGKSTASVEKIAALEKKKDDAARKSFNTQKKLMIAQAIMATAAGVASAASLVTLFPYNFVLAGIIGAMGLAQVAIIAGTQYGGGAAKSAAAATPSSLSIGKRSDTVDLARGPSANAGGESGFIRGSQGTGSNASNFRTIGSAYGGDLMRGYGNRGFVVGEKGPEIITPETPINVTPANDAMTATPVNATFNIQALDASDVQRVLVEQKGNIIAMIRQAANASGQGFLEEVNTNIYTRPNTNRL